MGGNQHLKQGRELIGGGWRRHTECAKHVKGVAMMTDTLWALHSECTAKHNGTGKCSRIMPIIWYIANAACTHGLRRRDVQTLTESTCELHGRDVELAIRSNKWLEPLRLASNKKWLFCYWQF